MTALPSAQQLEKLPLRAIAAYAARSVRRVLSGLPVAIDDCLIDEALSMTEAVASSKRLERLDPASPCFVASRVAEAMIPVETWEERRTGLSILSALRVAYAVLQATVESNKMAYYAAYAARAAEATAARADVLEETMAVAANDAAARDYEILLRTFGEHETAVVGPPIDLSAKSPLGSLM